MAKSLTIYIYIYTEMYENLRIAAVFIHFLFGGKANAYHP